MTAPQIQFNRKGSIVVSDGKVGLDLSDFHYKFQVNAMDAESPNNAAVRVYNLSQKTINRIKGEFSRITMKAGYDKSVGQIFDGTIKQLRIGRESSISSYIDIFAADSDISYSYGIVKQTLAAGSSPSDRINATSRAAGLTQAPILPDLTGVNPAALSRGKVLFGMCRNVLRDEAKNLNATWSIQNGRVQVIEMQQYLPNEVVELTSQTGLIGVPEQTDQGIMAVCLLNPRIRVGGLIRINNSAINQFATGVVGTNPAFAKVGAFGVPYNQWTGIQFGASVAADGYYRVYVIEYTGDNRGHPWYTTLTCLSLNKSNNEAPVLAKN